MPQHVFYSSLSIWKNTYSNNLYPVIYPLRTNDNTEVDIQAPLTRVASVRRGTRGHIICNKPILNNVVLLARNQVIEHAHAELLISNS